MPISIDRAKRHVFEQSNRLSGTRSSWPQFLYHACDVTTAVRIIQQGMLKCRRDAEGYIDVANAGALNNFENSHSFARVYFRPKNSFHFRTEGIKCINDPNRLASHMSIPVMFLFDFVSVITLASARFSCGNIQKTKRFLDGDDQFDSIDFSAVFHDGPTNINNRESIHDMRMSEVLVENSIPLAPHLRAILFRTQSDLMECTPFRRTVG